MAARRLRRLAEIEERCRGVRGARPSLLEPPLNGTEILALIDRPPGPWINDAKQALINAVLDEELQADDRTAVERFVVERFGE